MEYSGSCLKTNGAGIQPESVLSPSCGSFSSQPSAVEVLEQTSPQMEGKKAAL